MILMQLLMQWFYNRSKIETRLELKTQSWSYQNITHSSPLIDFLLRSVYTTTPLKRLHVLGLLYPLTHGNIP